MKKQEREQQTKLFIELFGKDWYYTPEKQIAENYYCSKYGSIYQLYDKPSYYKLRSDDKIDYNLHLLLSSIDYYTTIDTSYTGNCSFYTRTEKIQIEKNNKNYMLYLKYTYCNTYFYIKELAK